MDDLVIGYSKNLSKGGMFLRTSKFLPVDSVVRLHIELPDGGGEVTVACRVAYVRDETEWGAVGQPAGMGVQFLDPNDDARARLEGFIGECTGGDTVPKTPPPPRPIHVLVVDDDAAYCEVAAEPFRLRGDAVRVAHDGIDGLAMCLKEKPDVILCDVQMPKMDGWQLLRMIRARPALARVPFVFLTTLASEEDRLLGYRLGVDDYIAKPYRPAEVVARADRALARVTPASGGAADKSTLRGDLAQVGLPSLLSFLELERKTGVLLIVTSTPTRISLRDGAPVRIERGTEADALPKAVLFELFDARSGTFEFTAGDVAGADSLGATTTMLLLEHARILDESSRR